MNVVHELVKESRESVPGIERRMTFAKEGYVLGAYIPMLSDQNQVKRIF